MEKDFDRWNADKKRVNLFEFRRFVHEREVWWCAIGLNVGSETDGKHERFERPVLVVKKFNRDMVLVVPLTTQHRRTPYHIASMHRGEEIMAVISQLRLISTKRFIRLAYRMDAGAYQRILDAIRSMF